MKKYEYKTEAQSRTELIQEYLDRKSADGWELFSFQLSGAQVHIVMVRDAR
jgi:hypothetical protein